NIRSWAKAHVLKQKPNKDTEATLPSTTQDVDPSSSTSEPKESIPNQDNATKVRSNSGDATKNESAAQPEPSSSAPEEKLPIGQRMKA
ncbi:hypothetical protein LTS18_015099, partial [Coniosporium uncinatum]